MQEDLNTIRTLLVDDERSARCELRFLLEPFKDFTVIGEASSCEEAEKLIIQLQPDLLLLDVHMPRLSGFDLLSKLDQPPATIFITAYDNFALQAFEVHAFDYLLKPVCPDRLEDSLKRFLRSRQKGPNKNKELICAKDGRQMHFLSSDEICAVVGRDDYCALYLANGQSLLSSATMTEWAELLPADNYWRISRSLIVNHHMIRELRVHSRSEGQLLLKGWDSSPFELGRTILKRLRGWLDQKANGAQITNL